MIEALSLSPDFPKWSWEQSNGNSTDGQVRNAYGVLMEYGRCSDFSRFVWNDIVDVTANALAGVGLEWDAKYCSADDCKIKERYGVLMAYAWNSVAWNIKRLGFVSWKWARRGDFPGCVGHDAFVGFSTHGIDGEYLYAWYLLEITEKLNRLIEVLKDEWYFSELGEDHMSETIIQAKLSAPRITATDSTIMSVSDYASDIISKPIMPMISDVMSGSAQESLMDVLKIAPFISRTAAQSHHVAPAIALGIAPAKAFVESATRYISQTVKGHSAPSEYVGEIIVPYIAPFNVGHSVPGESLLQSVSDSDTEMRAAQVVKADSVVRSDSHLTAEAFIGRAKFAEGENVSESAYNGVVTALETKPIRSYQESKTIPFAEAKTRVSKAVAAAVQASSMVEASLEFWMNETWYDPVRTGSNLHIRSVYNLYDEDTNIHIGNKFLEPKQEGTNLHVKSVYTQHQEGDTLNIGSVFYEAEQKGK
jgi:hypothetical protein